MNELSIYLIDPAFQDVLNLDTENINILNEREKILEFENSGKNIHILGNYYSFLSRGVI